MTIPQSMEPNSLSERLAACQRKWVVRITHVGRNTGTEYVVTVWFTVEGETVYLQTMNVKRNWFRNVNKNPEVVLTIGGATFRGSATRLTDPAELRHVGELLKRKYLLAWPYLWLWRRIDGAFRVRLD